MATRVIDDSKLQDIAVAIRGKDGGGQMTVDQMPTRIEENLQSKAVLDSVIDGSITSIESDVTNIRNHAFRSLSSLVEASFLNAIAIGSSAFFQCLHLSRSAFFSAETIGTSVFIDCSRLSTVILGQRAALSNSNALVNCPAIIYVKPEDLSWYSTATNWSTLYAQDRIKSIEDLTGDDLVWYQEQLARYQAA